MLRSRFQPTSRDLQKRADYYEHLAQKQSDPAIGEELLRLVDAYREAASRLRDKDAPDAERR